MLFLLLFTGCNDASITSHYVSEPIEIDGKLAEWANFPLQHFEDENFSISFQHSNNEIYMVLATRDRQMMKIVQTSGIDIWVDIDKKKDKDYGLHYVGDIDTLDFSQMQNRMASQNPEQAKRMKQKPGTLIFFNDGYEYEIDGYAVTEPEASVDMYKSVYLLEIRMPFLTEDIFADLKEGKVKEINVGLALGVDRSEMREQMKSSRSGGMGGGGGRGGGMGGGGGRGGGGKMGGGSMDRPQPMGKIEKWFKVELENIK